MYEDVVIRLQGDILINVKTWSQVIQDNKARMQFFQEKLEFEADRGSSLEFLKIRYAAFLEGVLEKTEETPLAEKGAEDARSGKRGRTEKKTDIVFEQLTDQQALTAR